MILIAWVLSLVVSITANADDAAELVGTRSGVIEGVVGTVSAVGVHLRVVQGDGPGRVVVIPWFEIRSRTGDWEVPEAFAGMERQAVIGDARRRRGDLRGCAEIYRVLAEDLVGSDSEMAIEVFGGLMDEALVRGDHYDAAVAMGAIGSNGLLELDGVDRRYRVSEFVPLVVGALDDGDGHRLRSLGERVISEGHAGALMVRAYGAVYGEHEQNVVELLSDLQTMRGIEGEYRLGFELISYMLSAQMHPEVGAREAARDWLMTRGKSRSGTWFDGWCRLAAGASFLSESDQGGDQREQLRSRGVVELIHVIVQRGVINEYLVSVAYEMAIKGFVDGERFDEAGTLANDFDVLVEMMAGGGEEGTDQ